MTDESPENRVAEQIIGAAIEVHKTLGGPGLLESVYEEALVYELTLRGLKVRRQVNVPITYKDRLLATPLRMDMLIEDLVIVDNSDFPRGQVASFELSELPTGSVVVDGGPTLSLEEVDAGAMCD